MFGKAGPAALTVLAYGTAAALWVVSFLALDLEAHLALGYAILLLGTAGSASTLVLWGLGRYTAGRDAFFDVVRALLVLAFGAALITSAHVLAVMVIAFLMLFMTAAAWRSRTKEFRMPVRR